MKPDPPAPDRILGVDPSLRGTGFAVIERLSRSNRALHYGTIKNPSTRPLSACLLEIRQQLADVITTWEPSTMAIESTIFVQSYRTAITLGAARGAAILAAAERGIAVYEYAPRSVKQAVVGRGAAQKDQVAFMIRALLHLTETPPPDAADALAIAITHTQAADSAAQRRQPLTRV